MAQQGNAVKAGRRPSTLLKQVDAPPVVHVEPRLTPLSKVQPQVMQLPQGFLL